MTRGVVVSKAPAMPRLVAVLVTSPSLMTSVPPPLLLSMIWMPLPEALREAVTLAWGALLIESMMS